ncbi:MAG: cell division protein FtsL [Candidatus Aminicenantes bacterium]
MMVRKKIKKRAVILGISAALTAMLILTFYIWHQAKSIHLGYSIGSLEEQVLELEREVEKLEAEKSRLLSLERVESIARRELNLVFPEKEQLVFIEKTKDKNRP